MRAPEINFIRRFEQSLLKYDRKIFFYKIPDGFRSGNKPFDAILDNGHLTYALEFKSLLPNCKSFSVKNVFKPHQVRRLNQISELHKNCKTRNPAWAIVKRGSNIFVFDPEELKQERIVLENYRAYSLAQIVRLFCEI